MNKEISWLLQEKYQGQETAAFFKDVKRLEKGEPLDYVIGFANFLGCKIDLSKKPLIPRQETEYWVQDALKSVRDPAPYILDIFAGSGCVGIAIMRHIGQAKVTFAEKDAKFIQQIKLNCKANNISKSRYQAIQSDIFSNITGKFDYIFTNPPYIPTPKKKTLQSSVINYEPHQALFGGNDGLMYIRKFLAKAKDFLKEDGKIYLEFDSPQKKELAVLLKRYGYSSVVFNKDQYGRWRYVVASR